MAVDVAAKEVFAADGYANRRVVVFDSETGAYKRHWGAYGKAPSDEKTPRYDPSSRRRSSSATRCTASGSRKDGLVYVCDRTNNRLQIFRKDGAFVAEHVYEKATRGTGTVYDLVFSPDKEQKFIYMIDGMNGEVRIVDRASKETLGASADRADRSANSRRCTTSPSTVRATSLRPRCNTGQRVQKFRRLDLQN